MTNEARIETHPFVLRLKKFSPNLNLAAVSTLFDAVGDDLHVRPRHDIFVQGYEAHDFYLVERGFAIAYQLLHDGRRQIFAIAVPGDIIGPSAAGLQVARSSVSSLSEMRVQRLRMGLFLEIASRSPPLSFAMMCYLAQLVGLFFDRLMEVGRLSPLERVAHFLLTFHARLQTAGCAGETAFDLPVSQEVIGDLLSLSAPHVNRMLHRLRSDGLISMQRRRIDLLDIEGLRRLSEFAPPAPVPIPDDERLDSHPLITGLRQASTSLLTTALT
jgi:CRP-like cAMP-binding protein